VSFRKNKLSKNIDTYHHLQGRLWPIVHLHASSAAREPKMYTPTTKMEDIPDLLDLLETISRKKGKQSIAAVKRVYELCDVWHKQNRVPMLCSGKYNVLGPLVECLNDPHDDTIKWACLALNNLSIPKENKRVMALGPSSSAVIGGLCKTIGNAKKEAYLGSICLMNLSLLEECIISMLQYSPVPEGSGPISPLDNSESLICILQRVLLNAPKPVSDLVKKELLRWTCGLLKNLAKSEENAALLYKTHIPACVVNNIRNTTSLPRQWTPNSLEDFSLFIILHLAQWPVSRQVLIDAGAIEVIKHITVEECIQGLKASMACALLGAHLSDYPEGGLTAAVKSISELMSNINEEKGKDGQYAHGVFKIDIAREAYNNLCGAAAGGGELSMAIPLLSLV
ncbi:hypothetical protein ACHAXR_010696, partial [Thalassiosira sp. AJA248-18]